MPAATVFDAMSPPKRQSFLGQVPLGSHQTQRVAQDIVLGL
jgi:hypothetical protein